MKKIILSVTMLAITASTIFVACKKDEVMTNQKTQKSTTNARLSESDFYNMLSDSIGSIHNQALAYAFTQFQTNNTLQNIDSNAAKTLAQNYTKEFVANYWTTNEIPFDQNLVDFVCQGVSSNSYNDGNYSQTYLNKKSELLTLHTNSNNPSVFKSDVYSFLANNLQLLPESERLNFKSFALVLAFSNEYWSSNANNWVDEYNSQNDDDISYAAINVKNVGKADAEGVVSGAIGGAMGGAAAGGIGALPGAMIGATTGAIYGSVINAVFQKLIPGW